MKKNEIQKLKKLRLSRETLQTLTSSDNQKALGGGCTGAPGNSTGTSPLCPTVLNC